MKLPVTQAINLLKPQMPWIDQFYREKIPDGIEPDLSKTICIIQEWLNEPIYYANATFKGWTIGVEIKLCYAKNSPIRTLNNEIEIAKLFVKDGWTVEKSENHIQDPDTGQVIKVFYFAKDLILKESEK